MKKSTIILLFSLGAIFLVGVIIVSASYINIKMHLLEENRIYSLEKSTSLSLLLRHYIISGNLSAAYNYIDQISEDLHIKFFDVILTDEKESKSKNQSNLQYNLRQKIYKILDRDSIYRDELSDILFVQSNIFYDSDQKIRAARLNFGFSYKNLNNQLENLKFKFIIFNVIMLLTFLYAIRSAKRFNDKNYELLLNYFFDISHNKAKKIPKALLEYQIIIKRAKEMAEKLNILKNYEKDAAIGQTASQVAHDIRSPLAALNAVTKNLPEVDEEKRLLIRRAVQRIDDIANDLSSKKVGGADKEVSGVQESKNLETHLLSSLVEPLISEKRLQHRSKLGVEIRSDLDEKSYGLFAKVNVKEFKRLLSNLINNAVEVLENSGQVIVSLRDSVGAGSTPVRNDIVGANLSVRPDMIMIKVQDNGKGIPPEILSQLAKRGNTFGKEGGSGLGLYHAKTTVENLGGEFKIESEMNHGTTVTLLLPKEKAPSWFVSKIHLEEKMSLVIIDDDQSIHQIWKERLSKLNVGANLPEGVPLGCVHPNSRANHDLPLQHFSNPDALREWYKIMKNKNLNLNLLFLCDYEFLGSKESGLDVIEDLGLAKQTILVTSRYEEKDVRERCARLKIKLIPKPLAGFVPIKKIVGKEPP